eukprot:scaffold133718_cov31-Tisochrysis_lutea.AAC.3
MESSGHPGSRITPGLSSLHATFAIAPASHVTTFALPPAQDFSDATAGSAKAGAGALPNPRPPRLPSPPAPAAGGVPNVFGAGDPVVVAPKGVEGAVVGAANVPRLGAAALPNAAALAGNGLAAPPKPAAGAPNAGACAGAPKEGAEFDEPKEGMTGAAPAVAAWMRATTSLCPFSCATRIA